LDKDAAILKLFDKMKAELDRQQTKLLEELDQTFIDKDRKLKIELSELQYQHQGIKSALLFTDKLLEMGHDLELTLNHDPIINRLYNFINDNHHLILQEDLPDITHLEFIASNESSTIQSIQQFGSIDNTIIKISSHHSYIQNIKKDGNIFCPLNQLKSFQIILKDDQGNLIDQARKGILQIDIKGPSLSPLVINHSFFHLIDKLFQYDLLNIIPFKLD